MVPVGKSAEHVPGQLTPPPVTEPLPASETFREWARVPTNAEVQSTATHCVTELQSTSSREEVPGTGSRCQLAGVFGSPSNTGLL